MCVNVFMFFTEFAVICANPGVLLGTTHTNTALNSTINSHSIAAAPITSEIGVKRAAVSVGDNDNDNDKGRISASHSIDHQSEPVSPESGSGKAGKKRVRINEEINEMQQVPARSAVDGDSVKDHYNQLSRKEVRQYYFIRLHAYTCIHLYYLS